MIKIFALIFANIFNSSLFALNYYNIKINNNSSMKHSFYRSNENCMNDLGTPSQFDIDPGKSISFVMEDKNSGFHCFQRVKFVVWRHLFSSQSITFIHKPNYGERILVNNQDEFNLTVNCSIEMYQLDTNVFNKKKYVSCDGIIVMNLWDNP